MNQGKGFGKNKLSNIAASETVLKQLIRKNWTHLSALAWKGYLEYGRGALFITIDHQVLAGGELSGGYICERETFRRELMSGPWVNGDSINMVNRYDPKQQAVIIFQWRGNDKFIALPYHSTVSTPEENYRKLGLKAEKSSFVAELLNLGTAVNVESDDISNPSHPFVRFIREQWELLATVAYQGYLKEGRGFVTILLGKVKGNPGEVSSIYFGERGNALPLLLKGKENRDGKLEKMLAEYDPNQQIIVELVWTHYKEKYYQTYTEPEMPPPKCYERLKGQIEEFTPTNATLEEKTKSIFDELAEYRQRLGLPAAGSETDKSTIAKLEIGDQSFFGINSGSNPNPRQITFRVNPITKTHAEADAFQQAADAGIKGGKARLIVDRDLCDACGLRGGVNSMAWQLNIEELEIITPSGSKTITVKPPNSRR